MPKLDQVTMLILLITILRELHLLFFSSICARSGVQDVSIPGRVVAVTVIETKRMMFL